MSEKLTIVLVGNDKNPRDMMVVLAKEIESRGHNVVLIVGEKPGECEVGSEHMLGVVGADMVFSGMSSSEALADPELEVLSHAVFQDIPFGLFSDAPGCFKREWFADFRENASFLGVLREDEVAEAQELFPRAFVKATGHPSRELVLAGVTRESVLQKLALPVNTKIILCSGSKDLAVNLDLLATASQAFPVDDPNLKGCRIIFCPHPGDKNDWKRYVAFPRVELVSPSTASTSEVLVVADVYVNALSTTYQDAAYRRIPTIVLLSELIRQKRRTLLGTDRAVEAEEGVAIPVHSVAEAKVALSALFNPRSPKAAAVREHQARCYPKPNPPGTAAKIAADLIGAVHRFQTVH